MIFLVTINYNEFKANDLNKIDHIIAVMSGKGGVGKSLLSGLVAIALKRKGFEAGILDADITGPSIPKMFGINVPPSGNENGLLPVMSKSRAIRTLVLFCPVGSLVLLSTPCPTTSTIVAKVNLAAGSSTSH